MSIEKSQFTFRKFPKIRRLPEEEKYYRQQLRTKVRSL